MCLPSQDHGTENSGTGTLATDTTSITVNHGLGAISRAEDIIVTHGEAWGNTAKFRIGNWISTHFAISAEQDPGQDVDFTWKAAVL